MRVCAHVQCMYTCKYSMYISAGIEGSWMSGERDDTTGYIPYLIKGIVSA